jgi:hypothetical protein
MVYQRVHKSSSWQPPSQAKSAQPVPRPVASPAQQDLQRLAAPEGSGNEAMDEVWAQRLEQAPRFGHSFANILVRPTVQRTSAQAQPANAPDENRTGMPLPLKAGLEQLSGLDLSAVRVHYNSDKPAQLNALAFTQGHEIEVGPDQERYLPHEAWHVVQQAQGRVKPTMQMKDGVPVNDDAGLEREADAMGTKAAEVGRHPVLSRLREGRAELVEDNTKGNRLSGQGKKGPSHSRATSTAMFSDFLRLQRWTGGNRAIKAAILNKTAPTVQRIARDKALAMLKDGIASLAKWRSNSNSSIEAYNTVRDIGPEEGLENLDNWKLSELGRALGLIKEEEMALYAYSQPNKGDPQSAFYMGINPTRWGPYYNGWQALNSAVDKLPTLADLGLEGEQIAAFRVERKESKFMENLAAKAPCYILHGEKMNYQTETRHFASASVMGSSVHTTEERAKFGRLRFECPSARFIQAFGGMSTAVDGGEVLIPPGLITFCYGETYYDSEDEPVTYTLQEVGFEKHSPQPMLNTEFPLIEDKEGKDITAKFDYLYKGDK